MKYVISGRCKFGHIFTPLSFSADLGRDFAVEQATKAYGKQPDTWQTYIGPKLIPGTAGDEVCRQCGTQWWTWKIETDFAEELAG